MIKKMKLIFYCSSCKNSINVDIIKVKKLNILHIEWQCRVCNSTNTEHI